MDQNKLFECIEFFNKLKITEENVTSEIEKNQGCLVVVVSYEYDGNIYRTKRLFYKNVALQNNINKVNELKKYFESDVFWLDIVKHNWPHGTGAEIENTIIKDMFEGNNLAFEELLKKNANNQYTGYLQQITIDGRGQRYGFNFENNNHWHDLIQLVQYIIKNKGDAPPKSIYSRLVFKWTNDGRDSLSEYFGNRKILTDLFKNIKLIQSKIKKMEISKILINKKQIILQGPPGTGKTYTAKNIAEKMIFDIISEDKKMQKIKLENSDQFKLVQFHPSYSYEDFIRGITAKSNGTQIEYITENKVFAKFVEVANKNFNDSSKEINQLSLDNWLDIEFNKFVKKIIEKVGIDDNFKLSNKVFIYQIDEDCFRYKGIDWSSEGRLNFKDFKKLILDNINKAIDKLEINNSISIHAWYRQSYYMPILIEFFKHCEKFKLQNTSKVELKNYVLIIDEINRANLPAVMGELIYALEYRGEIVEIMYDIDGDNSLIIPPNLYIIGTMNTADRSVGHLDYAIRRRFAFVDILPDASVIKNAKAIKLFEVVSNLFFSKDTLASDFKANQVQLGHSYFIVKDDIELNLKVKFEIIPILEEYLKDGILLEKAEKIILDLKNNFEK